MYKIKAFTLMETIIVVVIVSILAIIAIPNYIRAIEKGRVAEAIALLGAIRAAQIRYKAQTGSFTTIMADLALNYTPPKFFQNECPCDGNGSPAGCSLPNIAQIRRNNFRNNITQYWFFIDEDANIQCEDGGEEAGNCTWLH